MNISLQSQIASSNETYKTRRKRVYYLSLEILIRRLLIDALTNMEMIEPTRAALAKLGVDLGELREVKPDAALGNGGLGRLAACFMESMGRCRSWPMVMASATITACSASGSRTGASSNIPKTGNHLAIHGNSRGQKRGYEIGFGGRKISLTTLLPGPPIGTALPARWKTG